MSDDVKGLLRQCAENLLSAVNRLERSGSPNSQQSTSTSTSTSSASNLRSTTQQVPVRSAAEEHRNLFGYRPPVLSRSQNRPLPPKRRMVTTSSGQQISVPVRNTWSHTFVCLLKKTTTSPPNAADKVNMALAGLGEKTITFSKGGNSEHVHGKILEACPDLAGVGGYQILRSGERGNRQLMVMPIPPGGYTVNYLKTTLASAKGYLRPFQKNITPVLDYGNVAGGVQSQIPSSPKVECVNCHQTVAMDSMTRHEEVCGGGSSSALHDSCRYMY